MKKLLKNITLLSVQEYADDPKYHRKGEPLNKQSVLKQIWEERLPENVTAQMVGKQYVMIVYDANTPPKGKLQP